MEKKIGFRWFRIRDNMWWTHYRRRLEPGCHVQRFDTSEFDEMGSVLSQKEWNRGPRILQNDATNGPENGNQVCKSKGKFFLIPLCANSSIQRWLNLGGFLKCIKIKIIWKSDSFTVLSESAICTVTNLQVFFITIYSCTYYVFITNSLLFKKYR